MYRWCFLSSFFVFTLEKLHFAHGEDYVRRREHFWWPGPETNTKKHWRVFFLFFNQAISTFGANVVSSAQLRSSCLNECSFRAEFKCACLLNLIRGFLGSEGGWGVICTIWWLSDGLVVQSEPFQKNLKQNTCVQEPAGASVDLISFTQPPYLLLGCCFDDRKMFYFLKSRFCFTSWWVSETRLRRSNQKTLDLQKIK